MKKGQKKRIWTKEDKLKIIKRYSEENISARELGRIYNADHSMICRWIREYTAKGEAAFEEVKKKRKQICSITYKQKHVRNRTIKVGNSKVAS